MTLRCVHKGEAEAQSHGTLMLEGPPRHTANRVFFNVPLGALPELRERLAVTPHCFRQKEVPLKKADSSGRSQAERVGSSHETLLLTQAPQDPCPSFWDPSSLHVL